MKYISALFLLWLCLIITSTHAATIGLHGIQDMETETLLSREAKHKTTVPIIGMIFDQYGKTESRYLHHIVSELWTGRIYHLSLSPYGYTAQEVVAWYYGHAYRRFFADIKELDIKVVFRTMHEMNGGRYSWASDPEWFKQAWKKVYDMARQDFDLQSDKLLFSLSYNSQDLPTTDPRPNQQSHYEYCSEWRINNRGRCPRMEDYYPGDTYVDLVWFTLYNRWRSRPASWSIRKSPSYLLEEADLIQRVSQRNKPLIIDELGSTAVKFDGERSQARTRAQFLYDRGSKTTRIRDRQTELKKHPQIKAIVYFNLDATAWATKQVLWQADRSIVMLRHARDYPAGIRFLTRQTDALFQLFE